MNHILVQKVSHYKVITGNINRLYDFFQISIWISFWLCIYFFLTYRGSADNITVVVINLKDRKYSISEIKKNQ